MLKLSILLLVGTWLSCPRDFLHQKFRQLSFSVIWHCREMQTAFQICTLQLLKLWQQQIVTLSNKMWKSTLLILFKKDWVSNLFCFFSRSKIVVCRSIAGFVYGSWSGCPFLWVYQYNKPQVFGQSDHAYYLSYFVIMQYVLTFQFVIEMSYRISFWNTFFTNIIII